MLRTEPLPVPDPAIYAAGAPLLAAMDAVARAELSGDFGVMAKAATDLLQASGSLFSSYAELRRSLKAKPSRGGQAAKRAASEASLSRGGRPEPPRAQTPKARRATRKASSLGR